MCDPPTGSVVFTQKDIHYNQVYFCSQVADLIVELGPNGIDILTHVKIELLESIQEVGHMELPTGWFGNSISELSSILMKAWSNEQGIDLQRT